MATRHARPTRTIAALAVTLLLSGCGAAVTSRPAVPEAPAVPLPATATQVVSLAATASATTTPAPGPSSISGFAHPTNIVAPDDGSDRLFVTDQAGIIRVVQSGSLLATPALDIRPQVRSTGSEQGLLGLAFPPGFAAKQYAYIYFTDTSGNSRFYRIRVSSTDTDTFDPASMQLILKVTQPYANHNGGQLAFGPDGYLYIGLGDGGSERDPHNYGQNLKTLLAKILRIDTESTPDSPGYRIPPTNPFVHRTGVRHETWVYGLRNPWRFSFDPSSGDLWVGDVGQDKWEEVDVLSPRNGGANLGWSLYEGSHLFKAKRIRSGFKWPLAQYSHAEGDAIVGGYLYRGARYPGMQGMYVFGDYGTGKIWTLRRSGTRWVRRLALSTGYTISTFGVDQAGDLWVADRGSGVIHRLGDLSL